MSIWAQFGDAGWNDQSKLSLLEEFLLSGRDQRDLQDFLQSVYDEEMGLHGDTAYELLVSWQAGIPHYDIAIHLMEFIDQYELLPDLKDWIENKG